MRTRVNLRTARRIRRWRISALAQAAQVHRSTLSRLEHGVTVPVIGTRERLEALLGLGPGDLVFERRVDANRD